MAAILAARIGAPARCPVTETFQGRPVAFRDFVGKLKAHHDNSHSVLCRNCTCCAQREGAFNRRLKEIDNFMPEWEQKKIECRVQAIIANTGPTVQLPQRNEIRDLLIAFFIVSVLWSAIMLRGKQAF